jgi:hypothetical protein
MRPVPAACTLPTAEQPLRVAEFTELFAALLSGVERTSPTSLALDLRAGPAEEARVRDLAAKEAECCSFFSFAITRRTADRLRCEVRVPAAQAAVLDGLAGLAATAMTAGRS